MFSCGLIIGILIGCYIGVFAMSLLFAAAKKEK
jgi:hypothetical protein